MGSSSSSSSTFVSCSSSFSIFFAFFLTTFGKVPFRRRIGRVAMKNKTKKQKTRKLARRWERNKTRKQKTIVLIKESVSTTTKKKRPKKSSREVDSTALSQLDSMITEFFPAVLSHSNENRSRHHVPTEFYRVVPSCTEFFMHFHSLF